MGSGQPASRVPLVLRVYTRWHARKDEQVYELGYELGCADAEFFGGSHACGFGAGVSCLICDCFLSSSPQDEVSSRRHK